MPANAINKTIIILGYLAFEILHTLAYEGKNDWYAWCTMVG